MPQGRQGVRAQGHGQGALLRPAGPAPQDALHYVQQGLLRVRPAAVGAAVRQGLISRQAQQLDLKGGFHQRRGLAQSGEGVQSVQQMGQQCPGGDLRRRDGLRQLREVAAQGQCLQIRPQAVEQLRRGPLVGVVPLALLIQGPLGIGQLLGAGGVLAALPPDAPGDDGDLAPLRCQQRQNFVRLFRLCLPQDHALCHDVGPLGQRAPSLLCTESVRPPFYALIPPPDSRSRAA